MRLLTLLVAALPLGLTLAMPTPEVVVVPRNGTTNAVEASTKAGCTRSTNARERACFG